MFNEKLFKVMWGLSLLFGIAFTCFIIWAIYRVVTWLVTK